jgi:hypothetical protein
VSGPVGVEKLPLFEAARSAPPGPPMWSPTRYEPPYVTPPLARASDPVSSHRAAQAAFPDARAQNAMIVACLKGLGRHGGTALEIAEALGAGWDSVKVSRRLAGLRANYIVSYDGADGRPLVERKHEGHRDMVVHVAKEHAQLREAA